MQSRRKKIVSVWWLREKDPEWWMDSINGNMCKKSRGGAGPAGPWLTQSTQLPQVVHSSCDFRAFSCSSSLFDIHGESNWDLVNFQKTNKKMLSFPLLPGFALNPQSWWSLFQQMRKTWWFISCPIHTELAQKTGLDPWIFHPILQLIKEEVNIEGISF